MATHLLYGTKRAGSAAIELALRRCDIPYRLVNAASWKPHSALGALAKAVTSFLTTGARGLLLYSTLQPNR